MAKLGIVFGNGFSSKLTKLFTGSTAYHTVWKTDDFIYDMHLIRRRRALSTYATKDVHYYDFPNVTTKYLEEQLSSDESTYGWIDYLLFGLRPFYHLIGRSTPNAKGTICSEMINADLLACGYHTPWSPLDAPPSPGDLSDWLIKSVHDF